MNCFSQNYLISVGTRQYTSVYPFFFLDTRIFQNLRSGYIILHHCLWHMNDLFSYANMSSTKMGSKSIWENINSLNLNYFKNTLMYYLPFYYYFYIKTSHVCSYFENYACSFFFSFFTCVIKIITPCRYILRIPNSFN